MSATAITNVRTLHHINILVDDLDAGVAFYHGMVGLALDDTPDHDFPSQFFRFADGAQIHMNEFKEVRPFRAHFCIVVDDFNAVFHRMAGAGLIDIEPWGKVRRIASGAMQMFVRDPSDNLVEIASRPDDVIDADILANELVDVADDNQLHASGRGEHRRGI